MHKIENCEVRRLHPNRSLTPVHIGRVEMLMEFALYAPVNTTQVDDIITSFSPFFQRIGGIELLVPLAAQKGSESVKIFLYNALLEPGVRFPIHHSKLLIFLETLLGKKVPAEDLIRVRLAGEGHPDCVDEYEKQMI